MPESPKRSQVVHCRNQRGRRLTRATRRKAGVAVMPLGDGGLLVRATRCA
jgi:hypothetical protein